VEHRLSRALGTRVACPPCSCNTFVEVGGLHLHRSRPFSVGWVRGQDASDVVPLADGTALPGGLAVCLGYPDPSEGTSEDLPIGTAFFPRQSGHGHTHRAGKTTSVRDSPLGLWFFGTLCLSFVMGLLTPPRMIRWFPFQLKGVTFVFLAYGCLLLMSASFRPIGERIDVVLSQQFESLEFLWWLLGAGMVLSIRSILVLLLKWVQGRLNRWILPLSLWGLSVVSLAVRRMPSPVQEMGGWQASGFWQDQP